MARLLIQALGRAGHVVTLASPLRSFIPAPDPDRQIILRGEAEQDVERIAAAWLAQPAARPDAWFTYHNHYKAPDLLGPALTRRFRLPYVMAEASHAPKRADTWTTWHRTAEAALAAADLHLCFTGRDRAGLAAVLGSEHRLIDLPPFIDCARWPAAPARPDGVPRIVTVAMMRPGDKLDSYRFLAAALTEVLEIGWTLAIIGDGPASADVKAAFAAVPADRIAWKGSLAPSDLKDELGRGDLFAWPGFGEAFGLAYLEAQVMGLPVVALETAGVPSVVRHGETGFLTAASPVLFAAALSTLIRDPARRRFMGSAASRFVRGTRDIGSAAQVLDGALARALRERAAA